MQTLTSRVLNEYELNRAHWAILSTAGYYLPVSPSLLIAQIQSHPDEDFSHEEIGKALHDCINAGLLVYAQDGVVLSDRGNHLKDQINSELMETVE
ncbi:MAG: hypothetical protein QM703_27165 [Gemmatales bacterium]